MPPERYLPYGEINPEWVEYADRALASFSQSAGFGVLDIGGPHGIQLGEPEAESHWVRVTEVDSTKTPPRHGVEEVYRDPSAGQDAYKYFTRPAGLRLELPESWAVESGGGTAAVGDVVLVRQDAAGLWTFALGGGGTDWRPGKITARLGDGPQASYTVQPLKLGSGTTYADDGDVVTPCYRLDTEDRDEPILIDIPVGAGVLVRPSADDPEKFEMTPWGGLKRSVIEHLYRVCATCEDVGGGLFKIRVKMAIRHIGEYARDRRALWMPGTHGEENLEDNTDLSIDPE